MKTPRNAPCPCGSGKKYKKCCLREVKSEPVFKPIQTSGAKKAKPVPRASRPRRIENLLTPESCEGKQKDRLRALYALDMGSNIQFFEERRFPEKYLLTDASFNDEWFETLDEALDIAAQWILEDYEGFLFDAPEEKLSNLKQLSEEKFTKAYEDHVVTYLIEPELEDDIFGYHEHDEFIEKAKKASAFLGEERYSELYEEAKNKPRHGKSFKSGKSIVVRNTGMIFAKNFEGKALELFYSFTGGQLSLEEASVQIADVLMKERGSEEGWDLGDTRDAVRDELLWESGS